MVRVVVVFRVSGAASYLAGEMPSVNRGLYLD